MINNDEYIKRILIKCSNIMYKYPDVFPIVRTIRDGGNAILDNPRKDIEFYVKHAIETRIGLYFVVSNIVRSANTFWLEFSNEDLEKAIIKNILIHYSQRYPMANDICLWNIMLKQENLIISKKKDN